MAKNYFKANIASNFYQSYNLGSSIIYQKIKINNIIKQKGRWENI